MIDPDHAYPVSRQRPAWARPARVCLETCAAAFFFAVLLVGFIAGGM